MSDGELKNEEFQPVQIQALKMTSRLSQSD